MKRLIAACLGTLATCPTAIAQAPDLLSFAQGAIPVRVQADAAARVTMEQALRAIDGSPGVFVLTRPVPASTRISLVFELPAETVFERLAVPGVAETPSPQQSFVRDVEVWGSSVSASEGFVRLASRQLSLPRQRGAVTELSLHGSPPVRWVRLDLSGALDEAAPKLTLEFSEIVGEGRQKAVPLATGFGRKWSGRGLSMALQQRGSVVGGCYDRGEGRLHGTVSGRLLQAAGKIDKSGVPSVFVAALQDDGTMQMLRSTNGAPFYLFAATAKDAGVPTCPDAQPPTLGCGSVIHGIRFDFDSATLRSESAPMLQALHEGLVTSGNAKIEVAGHTSSEGAAAHNQRLSEQRAQAVVDALAALGLPKSRLSASGFGASAPLAGNDDEAGRSLNRRVEIRCPG